MADLTSRQPSWADYLPAEWQSAINMSPLINALSGYINRRPADIEGASKRIFSQPGDREIDDRAWLLQQAQPQRRLNPLAAEMLDKGGLLANFIGPGAKLPAMSPKPVGFRAYHGSPHDFDEFDISKIGTGEGAQFYGRGLYFAEKEAVAKEYRDELSRFTPFVDGRAVHPNSDVAKYLRRFNGDIDGGIRILERQIPEIEREMRSANGALNNILGRNVVADRPEFAGLAEAKEALAILKDLQARGSTLTLGKGRMYEVNIKADPDQFLDWDKPLSQQPEGVKKAYAEALKTVGHPDPTKVEQSAFGSSGQGLENLIGAWVKHDRAKTSDILRDAGIPGIKYLDQGSRAAGQGSRNFVVFDDALVTILRKYGLLPPAAVAAAGATNGGLDDGLAP